MEDNILTILNELLEEAKMLVIAIQDEEKQEALLSFARMSAVTGKLAAIITEDDNH